MKSIEFTIYFTSNWLLESKFLRNKRIIEAEAQAEAIRLKAEAQAFAIEQKAKAEAEQMAKKADAWNEYKDAAMVDMILQQLPKVGIVNRHFSSHFTSQFTHIIFVIFWNLLLI